jgi:hypothetical protein
MTDEQQKIEPQEPTTSEMTSEQLAKLERHARFVAELTRAAMQIHGAPGLDIDTVVVAAISKKDGAEELWEMRYCGSVFSGISLMEISRNSLLRRINSST